MTEMKELIAHTRSVRRFREEERISPETLTELLELARLTGSHRNGQELRFLPVWQAEQCAAVFQWASFAAALGPAGRPEEGQRPAAYIALLGESREPDFLWVDAGLACQSMLLGATERGLAGCILGGLNREKLRPLLGLSESDPPLLLLLALGYPAEEVILEEAGEGPDRRKYRREGSRHYVPKLPLSELVLERQPR
ncbi:MAG: nitroreductase family protein [Firmicutes bacterium]|nr:nitroreductase family protein [Bacillota bacterium]